MNDSSIVGKILIEGTLVLKSPLLISDGAGETADNFRDIHVLKNREGKPFIPGTSLGGVLREWLEGVDSTSVGKIFGDTIKVKNPMQSSIQIDDIPLNIPPENSKVIVRDGVKIDSETGAAFVGGKYDFEAVERGATGEVRLLINLRGCHSVEKISETVSLMLGKLQDGIKIGALTSKGFGSAVVEDLTAHRYDFRDKADVVAWFLDKKPAKKILPATADNSDDKNDFVVDANFNFNSSFIIRDFETTLKSRNEFVIPGTSLKGIFRHRAEYILDKLNLDKNLLDKLMGTSEGEKIKSRFIVEESYISPENFSEVAHTRNKIDRFTGGTLQGTLFTTNPAYQKNPDEPTLKIHFEIRGAEDYEAGLALFLLRDLWTGRVAIGGEKSIGRGTVSGHSAEIKFDGKTYKLDADGKILVGDKAELERLAASLKNFSGGDGK